MEITKINLYAEGYDSGAEYEEKIIIKTDTYKKIKKDIDNITCYVYELNGKHSEVEGEIAVFHYNEKNIETKKCNLFYDNDGEVLYHELKDIFKQYNLCIDSEIKTVKDFLDSLDTYIDITVTVKKSNKEKVKEFCKNL